MMIIRKLGYNSSDKETIRLTIPKEFNWGAGEFVKFEMIDEDTIILKRLKDEHQNDNNTLLSLKNL